MRFDRGGKYYGQYIEKGQLPSSFVKFLEQEDVISQYTMPDTSQQNGVAKKRNRTRMDRVRSMISNFSLPLPL